MHREGPEALRQCVACAGARPRASAQPPVLRHSGLLSLMALLRDSPLMALLRERPPRPMWAGDSSSFSECRIVAVAERWQFHSRAHPWTATSQRLSHSSRPRQVAQRSPKSRPVRSTLPIRPAHNHRRLTQRPKRHHFANHSKVG